MKKCEVCDGKGGWKGYQMVQGFEVEVDADCEACEGTGVDGCNHDGWVERGRCEKCGATGLESDAEIYAREAPR